MKLSYQVLAVVLVSCMAPLAVAQVDYNGDYPWSQTANSGPDADVDGWWYNLGLTGMRVELLPASPKHLAVQYVFPGSPAAGLVLPGDVLTGAGGVAFVEDHQDGYGPAVFGAQGPIGEFAVALESAQITTGAGVLAVSLQRAGAALDVSIPVGTAYGTFGPEYPFNCPKSDQIRTELLDYLVANQGANGSWGSPPQDTFAPLALLTSDVPEHRAAALLNVEFHAGNTTAEDDSDGLVNWRYMTAGIVIAEYYLQTGEAKWLVELQEIHEFIISTQYRDRSQINPQSYISHPGSQPNDETRATGGWGHRPGFEGYGPIAMVTAQGALVLALLEKCGIEVRRQSHDEAYAFLQRGTGTNGYLWYLDEVANNSDWADMGRTGASAIAHYLAPYPEPDYQVFAHKQSAIIGLHPESFPDTHGSPPMGMAYAAAAGAFDLPSLRSLMDTNRFWFALSQCHDGSYYYQPNRDNAGYGSDSRIIASAVTAFVFSIPQQNLAVIGRP